VVVRPIAGEEVDNVGHVLKKTNFLLLKKCVCLMSLASI